MRVFSDMIMRLLTASKADTARINWLEQVTREGACPALVNDDNGHWAVVFDGMQSVSYGDGPMDVCTNFIIKKHQWRNTVRQAIDHALRCRRKARAN